MRVAAARGAPTPGALRVLGCASCPVAEAWNALTPLVRRELRCV